MRQVCWAQAGSQLQQQQKLQLQEILPQAAPTGNARGGSREGAGREAIIAAAERIAIATGWPKSQELAVLRFPFNRPLLPPVFCIGLQISMVPIRLRHVDRRPSKPLAGGKAPEFQNPSAG
jgi:hypothetical protein